MPGNIKKLVGKRQLQRRIKRSFHTYTKTCSRMTDTESNKTLAPVSANPSNTFVEGDSNMLGERNLDDKLSQNFESFPTSASNNNSLPAELKWQLHSNLPTSSQNISAYTAEDEKINDEQCLKTQIRQWVIRNNENVNSVTELLHILQKRFNSLPLDYRTLMETPRRGNTIKLDNGELIYFGLEKKIILKMQCGFKEHLDTLLLQVNIDGLPLFKSSSTEIYPILVLCNDFFDKRPFAAGIYCGVGKPDPIQVFLSPFLEDIKTLQLSGISFQGKTFDLKIDFFICDAPMRSYLRQTLGHTSKQGCEKCHMVGKRETFCINFAQSVYQPALKKKDSDFTSNNFLDYIKARSPLLDIGINLVTQFPLDPMHLIYLGVVKRLLLNYLVDGKAPYKLSQRLIAVCNSKISQIQTFITAEFVRKPRSFKELRRWKATEFRTFVTYTGPVILYNVIHPQNYVHFLHLHCAVYILSNKELIENYLDIAQQCLVDFVTEAPNFYGRDFVVFNVHNLLHLCDDVKLYGNINDFSCFPFENYLNCLKQKIHSKNNPLQQLYRRIEEFDNCLPPRCQKVGDTYQPKKKYNEVFNSEEVIFYCKSINYMDFLLSIAKPDNCIMLKNKTICLINSIRFFHAEYHLGGVGFKYVSSLYKEPFDSSNLYIFYVEKLDITNLLSFSLKDVYIKCIILPFKQGFAVFPVNHHL